MAQHDYVIDNASGATVRADINSALSAIQTLNSGTSEPSSTAAGMLWLDTTGGAPYGLKIRDAGNNHWLTIGSLTDPGANAHFDLVPGKINLSSSGGVFESDGSTEILTESSGAVTLKNTTIDPTVIFPAGGAGNPISVAVIADQKSSGTGGGSFASGAWRTRDLNTEISDPDSIVSITSNQFTLGAGTYLINWSAPAFAVNLNKSALYDVTGSSYLGYGTPIRCESTGNGETGISSGAFIHSPSASNVYEIRHHCATTGGNGFGTAGGSSTGSVVEIYTQVIIYKLK